MSAAAPLSFGYHPDKEKVDDVLGRGGFSRALLLDMTVRTIVDRVTECRVLWESGAELPEGLYWFQGLDDGGLLLQVGSGPFPGDATIVALDELSDDHPLTVAWNWAEDLWARATPVPRPRFALYEPVITHPGGIDVVVRDRSFGSGAWSYQVIVEGASQRVLEDQLRPRPASDDPETWVQAEPDPAARFGATLTRAKLEGKFANTLFSFRATRTTFRPYQFKPVLKLLETGKARLLIADEVGLGKTIEAGLIWTELEARQEADRVLIVCPSSLLGKWREEMMDRFEFDLTELDSGNLQTFLDRHQQNRLPRRHAYICSLERLRTWAGLAELRDVPPAFDLVIVDEAHAMRNADTRSYALGTELAEWADNLVFLTATPINLRQADLLNLLELLAPEDYGEIEDLMSRLEPNRVINAVASRLITKDVCGRELLAELEQLKDSPHGLIIRNRPDFARLTDVLTKDELDHTDIVTAKRYLAELNTLSTVITRTKKVEVDERKAKRTEDRREITWTVHEEAFYSEYVRWCEDRADAMASPLYFAMQMPLRLASACLPMARRAVLDPEGFGDLTDEDGDTKPGRLAPHRALIDAAEALPAGVDSKFDVLSDVLVELHRSGRQALLFTHSRPTLAYLANRLGSRFRIAVLHGGVERQKRRQVMADFRTGNYDFVLANRVASEGLDFEFCSAVINYDLPWNPMEIEQRIGRIDRIGQTEETVLVVNFINERTIDERILTRLLDRIEIFESSIGALEPIISEAAPALLKLGFDFHLTPAQREQKVHEALTALEEQRAGLRDVADASSALMVSNDVDVAGLEEDLVRTGRYIGQRELALLLDDWARVDGSLPVEVAADGLTMTLRGNATMASRVSALAQRQRRTGAETGALAAELRSELPVSLVMDQEFARTHGGTLLTATSPLVMAAVDVPGHRQARFAALGIRAHSESSRPGTYLVVLAKAVSGSRGGDEIWGEAVDIDGRPGGQEPVNDLLAALAEGRLTDIPFTRPDRLGALAERALNRLQVRHESESTRRRAEFDSLTAAREITLREQHERKMAAIRRRLVTTVNRGRSSRGIGLFESQLRRAQTRYEQLNAELARRALPELRVEPLATCIVEIVPESR
ncbi:hypothetical protein GCM10023221_27290 [Luteimicrobium xylanilyticum]|uniref:RNA polymerase-associated protein RapA n=1 Tax=Luteimicrobium xylanilyticum TaxID=1133546 RepID=A0A5P9QAR3_9MICO|nr:helicase-related protein [Luteimicrobium xylanilyticum]QFU98514.1 RNA polymerase-associated protein RapA [Luteimicrobium xylanilyticum]